MGRLSAPPRRPSCVGATERNPSELPYRAVGQSREDALSERTPMITRRTFLQLTGASAAALYVADPKLTWAQPASGWTDGDYWALADRLQPWLDGDWQDAQGAYLSKYGGGGTQHNANLLLTHAAAALAGHTGPARQDERARRLAARLCASPPWSANLPGTNSGCPSAQPPENSGGGADPGGTQTHACGWGSGLSTTTRQHVVIDTEVVRGLAMAYRARAAL